MSCISARVSLSLPVCVCVSNSMIITANVSLAKLNELLSVLRLRHRAKAAADKTWRSQSYFNYQINSIELCL